MLTKFIPATLLVLAALVTTVHGTGPLPATSIGTARSPTPSAKLRAPMATAVAVHAPNPIAIDDYRMNLQAGVTADAYELVPLVEHDAARTQSMIDGIAGRNPTHSAAATETDKGRPTSRLPRPETAALWLAGLMAVVLMALRRRG